MKIIEKLREWFWGKEVDYNKITEISINTGKKWIKFVREKNERTREVL